MSWSLNVGHLVSYSQTVQLFSQCVTFTKALNNSETLRLLAIIELSCYSTKHSGGAEIQHSHMRRIARVIKDDRRKRHKRRKDQDAMVTAFERTKLADMEQ
jgi:hypothetical protein